MTESNELRIAGLLLAAGGSSRLGHPKQLVDVTKRVGVFITIGDRFNNDPLGISKRNDFLFTTGMKWNFGKKR